MIKEEFDYISAGASDENAEKLVLLLHGYGVNASYMEKIADEIALKMPEAQILSLQAPHLLTFEKDKVDENTLVLPPPQEVEDPSEDLKNDIQREWFAITQDYQQMHQAMTECAVWVNEFLDEKKKTLSISEEDIAVMGFSQGGAVAIYAACHREKEVACLVGHSTLIMDTSSFKAKPPTLFLYGDDDKTFTPDMYKMQTIKPLEAYLEDFEVEIVEGLGHKTNHQSRKIMADYISRKMRP